MLAVNDGGLTVTSIQDEASSSITFNLIFADTEKNGGANAGQQTVTVYADINGSRLTIDAIDVKKILGQNVQFETPIKAAGVLLGGSNFAYVYGDNDDVYMRYKGNDGNAAYASAKTIMGLIGAINDVLSKTTTTAITNVSTANAAGALYSSVPSFYAVKNGWCFFHIWMTFTGSVGNWYPFYLPEIAVPQYLYFEDNYEHNGQLRIETSGRVRISNTKASAIASHYWGCYPTTA